MPASKDKGIGGQMWLTFFFLSCKVHDERKFFFSYETTAFGFLKGAFTNPVQWLIFIINIFLGDQSWTYSS